MQAPFCSFFATLQSDVRFSQLCIHISRWRSAWKLIQGKVDRYNHILCVRGLHWSRASDSSNLPDVVGEQRLTKKESRMWICITLRPF